MPKAKLLSSSVLRAAERAIAWSSEQPLQDLAMLSLSYRAALRAKEMAFIRVEHVTDPNGAVANWLRVSCKAGKGGKERFVPITPELGAAITRHLRFSGFRCGPLLRSANGKPLNSKAVVTRFILIYHRAGLLGTSSHSGRRTLATNAARAAMRGGCTLEEIMACLGHADVDTTMEYIERSEQMRPLVMSIR
ncbi:MAG TPA: site-specific integrase [Afifellaceae bacterium]|nr:site-specific integrase [Afifellaceae bacterium]